MDIRDVVIRDCTKSDANELADFYNKSRYGPINAGFALKEEDIVNMLKTTEYVLYLCLEYEKKIIGTMFFSKISGQKATESKAVWGSKFLIDPQYRLLGGLPSILFTEAIERLTDLGYHYIDVEVDPKNTSAFPLYKRVGFIRSSRSYIDYDGFIELRTYLPLLILFLKRGYGLEEVDNDMMQEGWRGLKNNQNLRSIDRDTSCMYGMEVAPYEMQLGKEIILCWIDLETDKVAMMEDARFKFTSYIVQGQKLKLGEIVDIVFEYENRLNQPVLVRFKTTLLNEKLTYKNGKHKVLLKAGESVKWIEKVQVRNIGQGSLKTSLRFGHVHFSFEYGVQVRKDIDILLENTYFYQHVQQALPIVLQNNTDEVKKGELLIQTSDLGLNEFNQKKMLKLKANEKKLYQIPFSPSFQGEIPLDISFKEEGRDESREASFELRVAHPGEVLRYSMGDKTILENLQIRVEVDQLTGGMDIFEKRTGQKVVKEAWPDSSYPLKSAIRRMLPRTIEVIFSVDSACIFAIEIKDENIHIIRQITLGNESLVEINDYLVHGNMIKIYPWCALKGTRMTVPMKRGLLQRRLIEEVFPLGIHDYEFVKDADLPSHPNEYSASWSSFENETMNVGLIWQGKVKELTYGLNWMPTIVFSAEKNLMKMQELYDIYKPVLSSKIVFEKLNKRKQMKLENWIRSQNVDATHYYKIGYGGYREVKYYWESLVGKQIATEQVKDVVSIKIRTERVFRGVDTVIHGVISTDQLSSLKGRYELEIPQLFIFAEKEVELTRDKDVNFSFTVNTELSSPIIKGVVRFLDHLGARIEKEFYILLQDKDKLITKNELVKRKRSVLEIDNASICFSVDPKHQGSIVNLQYNKKNLLRSNYPSLVKSWGDHTVAPGGIYPHLLTKPLTINRGLLFEKKCIDEFVEGEYSEKNGWDGSCFQAEKYDISYLTMSNLPILKIKTSLKVRRSTHKEQIVIHTVWNKFSSKRSLYYWGINGQSIYKETGKRGKFHLNDPRVILEVGNEQFVSIWSEDPHAEIAVYEWPDKGIELILLTDHSKMTGTFYMAFSQSINKAEQYLRLEMRHL